MVDICSVTVQEFTPERQCENIIGSQLSETFMLLFCEKNCDGTKNLILKGKDMFQRIGTRVKHQDMFRIYEFLRDHPEVVKLDLSYNDIGDYGFDVLIDLYFQKGNYTLKDLHLMSCDLTYRSVINFCKIPEMTLRSLRLTGNKIDADAGLEIAKLLERTDTLLHIDLGDSDQTLESIPYFWKVCDFRFNSCSLRVLDLSRVIPFFDRYPYDSAHFAEGIGLMLQYNTSLIEIHLQKNQFDCHDIELMFLGLQANRTLLMLDLGYNRVADFGTEVIGKYLETRPPLLGLNLAGNGITDKGARALSFKMPFSRIRLLDIGFNYITDIGILDILNSIKKPTVMRMLNIWGNKITHETNYVIERMLMSGVLVQDYLDVKVYEVDEVLYTAYYPSDHYKHRYYNEMDYGCPVDIKIKKVHIPNKKEDKPRALVDFNYYPRIPERIPAPPKCNCKKRCKCI